MTESPSGGSPTPDAEHGVGLVVVSHSRTLARSAVALAAEMLHGRPLRIEVAAGLDDTTFGTDAVAILEAIERADGPAGVVVLMDLGSAVLSTELALDLLQDPSIRDRVTLSPAPLVEGLIVAAVAAAGGASRAEVAAEARDALLGKSGHLSTPLGGATPGLGDVVAEEVVGVFSVENPHGLHARPAARLVSEVRALDASVRLRNLTTGGPPVPAGSLSRVATLAALRGHEVEVRASGPQAQEAVEHVLTLAARRFDETVDEAAEPPAPARAASVGGPLAASPGIAIGPARRLTAVPVDLDREPVGEPAAEWRRIVECVGAVRRDIEHVRVVTVREVGAEQASIFDAHLSLLTDVEMLADVKARIGTGIGAVSAWAGLPGRRRARVGGSARSVPEGKGRRCPGGCRAGAARVDGRARAADDGAGNPRGQRPDAGRDRRPRPRPGDRRRARSGEPELARGDPGQGPGHPGGRRGRSRGAHHPGRHHAAPRRRRRRAARRSRRRPRRGVRAPRGGRRCRARAPARSRRTAGGLPRRSPGRRGREPRIGDRRPCCAGGRAQTAPDSCVPSSCSSTGAQRPASRSRKPSTTPSPVPWRAGGSPCAPWTWGETSRCPTCRSPRRRTPSSASAASGSSLDHRDLLRDQMAAICHTARHSPTSMMIPMVSTPAEMIEALTVLTEAAGPAGRP